MADDDALTNVAPEDAEAPKKKKAPKKKAATKKKAAAKKTTAKKTPAKKGIKLSYKVEQKADSLQRTPI